MLIMHAKYINCVVLYLDLSVKRPLLPHNLNVTEAVAVKQLITGYREAAAFLLRSADELEQLLLNQQQ